MGRIGRKKIKTINRLESFDCEPIYKANEFEKELIRVSRKLIEMGEVFTEAEIERDIERICKELEEEGRRKTQNKFSNKNKTINFNIKATI